MVCQTNIVFSLPGPVGSKRPKLGSCASLHRMADGARMSPADLSERGIMPTREPTHEEPQPRQSLLVRLVIALPNWGLRVLLWFLSRIIYRVKVLGKENIPGKGGALLVSNHMCFFDVVFM
jgi:hypothetical protein